MTRNWLNVCLHFQKPSLSVVTGYPVRMVTVSNIVNKVRGFSRNISPKQQVHIVNDTIPITIVSTYGVNDFLESTLANYATFLRESSSFYNLQANVKN